MRSLSLAIILALLTCCGMAHANPTRVVQCVDRRPATSLDGDWHVIVDPYFSGLYSMHHEEKKNGWFLVRAARPDDGGPTEYDFSKSPTLHVPGDWNTQRENLFFYEGPLWYQRDVEFTPTAGKRVFLHVGAANYRAWFWINGQLACQHEGGFTSFDCEVTPLLHAGRNTVVAAVNNARLPDGVPTLETDWWNYGGLTRDVSLFEVPAAFIDAFDLHLVGDRIQGWVHLDGGRVGDPVSVSIDELHAAQTSPLQTDHRATFDFAAGPSLVRWSPSHPRLYATRIQARGDTLSDPIGYRTITTKGRQILLNGEPVFLRGVSIHAEAPFRSGRACTDADATTLLKWARELGCNYVRLAHYPHDERMLRAADRMGVMVWSEIPVYWAVHFDDAAVYSKAEQQLDEMIARDRDKACIVLWSVANETPATSARTAFLRRLVARVREADPTRLVTAALLVRGEKNQKIIDDPLGRFLDVLGANEYIGWYEQRPEAADHTTWRVDYDKPLIVSEFGGDARAGLHGRDDERWTEEYQANIYRHQLGMLARIKNLAGISPWILMDFRSPSRQLPGIQDFFNRKGLISEQGVKKAAFYVLQEAYTKGAWTDAR